MDVLELDIETFSTVELKKSNVYAYVEDPAFEILMCGWSLNDSPVEVWEGERDIREIPGLFDPDVKKVAHNASFERVCFSRLAGMPVGRYIEPEQYFDTMAIAREYGYPASLDALAKALGADPKDSAGERLINLFCKPRKVPRQKRWVRVMPSQRPEQWKEFRDYCAQDVVTLKDVRRRLPGWPSGFERELWYVDQRINDRGLRVDLPLARKAIGVAKDNDEALKREVIEITGIENPVSTQQLGKWCADVGFPMENWQARTVEDGLARANAYGRDDVRRVLELRQELALVAHRKYEAVLRGVSVDGRLRGQFVFHAAHTGRWSSRGVQVHNLPRLAFERRDEDGEKVYDETAERAAILDLMHDLGGTPETLKKLVRPMFILDGTTSDFSAIEARVLAWLAGEEWVLRAFEEGRDLYVETASRMGGMTRQQGKIAVLACGYQGSVGSMRNMGYGGWPCPWDIRDSAIRRARMAARDKGEATVDETNDEPRVQSEGHKCNDEIQVIVDAWRAANPRIVNYWKRLEQAFRNGGKAGRVTVLARGSQRRVVLPSGRTLYYHQVSTGQRVSYRHVQGYREVTYGGRLTENVTQAAARDLLGHALINLDRAGYPLVGHVHDEALAESKDTEGIRDIMKDGPAWAEGLPLDASADILYRYRKD
jgi:DNA polymerase